MSRQGSDVADVAGMTVGDQDRLLLKALVIEKCLPRRCVRRIDDRSSVAVDQRPKLAVDEGSNGVQLHWRYHEASLNAG